MLPSIGAILILDHFVIRRRGAHAPGPRPVHWPAIAAWTCGFAAGYGTGDVLPGIQPLNTLLAASAAYLLLARRPAPAA